jgi:hypothetical protein
MQIYDELACEQIKYLRGSGDFKISLSSPMGTLFLRILFSMLMLSGAISMLAQNGEGSLLLMNGEVIKVDGLNDSTHTYLEYLYDKNQFKRRRIDMRSARKSGGVYRLGDESMKGEQIPIVLKEGRMEREDVFSFTTVDGKEKLYYFYDEGRGNLATEEEMRAFVIGERDARLGVRGNAWLYSGLAVGFATGYAARNSVLALAVPPIFALGARIPVVRIREETIQDLSYQYNEEYAAGYESQARGKFTRKALLGSAIGTALGLISYAVVDNNF